MKTLTFVTGNPKKVEQLKRYLDFPVSHAKIDLPEIQSLDVTEVAVEKAKAAYAVLGTPVLVEDISLSFEALGGLPGPLVKWFLHTVGNEGMCRMLDTYANRTAWGRVCFVLCDETGPQIFMAERKGTIAESPRGPDEFGWNPIFVPEGEHKTWAEMSVDEQKATSLRRLALERLQQHLLEHYQ